MAGLGRKEFNAGDILLASEVQGYLQDQAVMVFDDAAARGSAIPTPSEGMLTYNKDTDALELYDGSAFGPVGSDAGLIHIKTETFSAVSGIPFNDVFSSEFSNYLLTGKVLGSTNNRFDIRLRSGTTDDNAANYERQFMALSGITFTNGRGTGQTAFIAAIAENNTSYANEFKFSITAPFETERTSAFIMQSANDSGNISMYQTAFRHTTAASYDGLNLIVNTGNVTGTISLYGYRK